MSPLPVRCFWAVRPPDESLECVGQLVRLLKGPLSRLGLQLAWAPRDSYHLTLKFLGEVDEDQLGAMVAEVQTRLRDYKRTAPLQLGLGGLGVFPGPQRPHVLYVDTREGTTELTALHQLVDQALAPLGYSPEDRRFHPHLTIGRVRSVREAELHAALPELLQSYTPHRHGPLFPIETLTLYESLPAASGPRYTPIARLPLAVSAAAAGPAP